jgi:hypothetical protein
MKRNMQKLFHVTYNRILALWYFSDLLRECERIKYFLNNSHAKIFPLLIYFLFEESELAALFDARAQVHGTSRIVVFQLFVFDLELFFRANDHILACTPQYFSSLKSDHCRHSCH